MSNRSGLSISNGRLVTPLFVGLTIHEAIQVYWQVLHSAKELNTPASWYQQQQPPLVETVWLGCFSFEKTSDTCIMYTGQVFEGRLDRREILGKAILQLGVPLSQIAVELLKPVLQQDLYVLAYRDLFEETFQVEVVERRSRDTVVFPAQSLALARAEVFDKVRKLKEIHLGTDIKVWYKTKLGSFIGFELFEPASEGFDPLT